MGDAEDGRWMTFAELAAAREISKASASRLVRRHGWRRQRDNQGTVRILVPPGAERRSDHRVPDSPADSPPVGPSDKVSLVRALQDTVALLREQLAKAEARADQAEAELRHERETARRTAEQLAALSADLVQLAESRAQVPDSPPHRTGFPRVRRWVRRMATRLGA